MVKGHQRLKARWLTSMVSSRSRSEQSLREWASVGVSTHSGRELSLRVLRNLMILDVQCVNWTVVLAYIIIAIKQIGGINVLFKFWMLKIQIFQHLRNFFLLHLLKWSRFVTQKVLYHLVKNFAHFTKFSLFSKILSAFKIVSFFENVSSKKRKVLKYVKSSLHLRRERSVFKKSGIYENVQIRDVLTITILTSQSEESI